MQLYKYLKKRCKNDKRSLAPVAQWIEQLPSKQWVGDSNSSRGAIQNKMISRKINQFMKDSSWIRKMFEEGVELKKKYGEENVFDFSLGNPNLDPPEIFFDNLKKVQENFDMYQLSDNYAPKKIQS